MADARPSSHPPWAARKLRQLGLVSFDFADGVVSDIVLGYFTDLSELFRGLSTSQSTLKER